MKFGLEIRLTHPDGSIPLVNLGKDKAEQLFAQPQSLEGAVVPLQNGKAAMDGVEDPLLPMLEAWMLKVPWLLQGDTETLYFKNSEHAFGFEVLNESVVLSFYLGEGNEIEEYVMEPFPVPLDTFCDASISAVRAVLTQMKQANPKAGDVPDVKTLQEATIEAERALKEYRLDRR